MNVTAVRESDWNKDGTIVKVTTLTLEDGREVPGYDLPSTPEAGKPLPDGWEIATSKSGKPYIKVPKKGGGFGGGGATAFRNTKEGQAFEQQQMNRRTALMQAVAIASVSNTAPTLTDAQIFYDWLQASPEVPTAMGSAPTSGVSTSRGVADTTPPGSAGEVTPAPLDAPRGNEEGSGLAEVAPDPSSCIHPSRTTTATGKVRCIVCSTIIEGAA